MAFNGLSQMMYLILPSVNFLHALCSVRYLFGLELFGARCFFLCQGSLNNPVWVKKIGKSKRSMLHGMHSGVGEGNGQKARMDWACIWFPRDDM